MCQGQTSHGNQPVQGSDYLPMALLLPSSFWDHLVVRAPEVVGCHRRWEVFSFQSKLSEGIGRCTVCRHGYFAEVCKGCTLRVHSGKVAASSHLTALRGFGRAWKGLWGQEGIKLAPVLQGRPGAGRGDQTLGGPMGWKGLAGLGQSWLLSGFRTSD